MNQAKLAIIGGSGLYSLMDDEFKVIHREIIQTPYGEPSGPVTHIEVAGKPIVFIARHGYTHRLPPHKINYRANIWMLKELGIEQIVAVNAVGGINKRLPPQGIAIADQLIDYTYGRDFTFYEQDLDEVIHVDFTYPYDERLRQQLIEAAAQAHIDVMTNGIYGCTQGPRLETAAEIVRLQKDGCDMVGMTAMPETSLAREKGINYAALALSVNWAAGITKETLNMSDINEHLSLGMCRVKKILLTFIQNI